MGIFSRFISRAANKAAQATNWLSTAGAIPAQGIGKTVGKAVTFVLGNPIASRIVGLGLTISGGINLGKYLAGDKNDRDTSGKYSGIASIILGGSMVLFNDKEWYLDEDMSNVAGVPSWVTKRSDYNIAELAIPLQNCVVIDYDQSLPYDVDNTINQSIDSIFRNLRSAARYNGAYNNADVRRYVTNVYALTTAYSTMVRLYGLLNAYNTYDSTTPRTYLYGLGLNDEQINDLTAHLADFRYFLINISKAIVKVAQIAPMYALERASYYASMAFLDAPNEKATPIFLNPRRIEIFNSNTNNYEMYYLKGQLGSIEQMRQALGMLINELGNGINSVIASDMVTAYGTSAYVGLVVPEEDYIPAFFHDSEIMTELHNASFWCNNELNVVTGELVPAPTNPMPTNTLGMDQINGTEGLRIGLPASICSTTTGDNYQIEDITIDIPSPRYVINGDPNDLSAMGTIVATRFVSVIDYSVTLHQSNMGENTIQFNPMGALTHSGIILTNMAFVSGRDDIVRIDGYGNTFFIHDNFTVGISNIKQVILARWEQVAGLPRICFLYNPTYTHPTKITADLVHFNLIYDTAEAAFNSVSGAQFYSFYDYNIFAVYDDTLKLPYDSIANYTLFSTNIILKEVATTSAKIGISESGNKGGNKNGKNKNKNKNSNRQNGKNSGKNNSNSKENPDSNEKDKKKK